MKQQLKKEIEARVKTKIRKDACGDYAEFYIDELIFLFDTTIKELVDEKISLQEAEELGLGGHDNQYWQIQQAYNQALKEILEKWERKK